jgi:hypothetical protein
VDVRTLHLEVVVLLGIELGEHLGVPGRDEVVEHRGGGVAGVVPPFEGGNHPRVTQRGNRDVVHVSRLRGGQSLSDR